MMGRRLNVGRLLERVTYKPNVRFEATEQYGRVTVKVTIWTLDSHKTYPEAAKWTTLAMFGVASSVDTDRGGTYRLEPMIGDQLHVVPEMALDDEDVFWIWLRRSVIGQLEDHEADEWFKIDGKCVDNPHTRGNRMPPSLRKPR
jgi:hypothetical protein